MKIKTILMMIGALVSLNAAANDFPTEARAEYVFGCMATNGQNPVVLNECSCSIDYIASVMPFAEYEKAKTVMQLSLSQGAGRVTLYRNTTWAQDKVKALKNAMLEADLKCFPKQAHADMNKKPEQTSQNTAAVGTTPETAPGTTPEMTHPALGTTPETNSKPAPETTPGTTMSHPAVGTTPEDTTGTTPETTPEDKTTSGTTLESTTSTTHE